MTPKRRYGILIPVVAVGLGMLTGFLMAPSESAIVAGLPNDPDQMAVEWNDRVRVAFPDGTPVSTLVSQLQAAKFTVDDSRLSASRQRTKLFACSDRLFVRWSIDGDQAKQVEGTVFAC
ncbi:hypothetical protein [Devosia sp. A16]|uniref:hypothetical protein n=1 Tax=Devosia sp. A16 TaxID=1736675 RepID=UPI0012E31C39|nr:hypothetical protein [Devosia sp. A16]